MPKLQKGTIDRSAEMQPWATFRVDSIHGYMGGDLDWVCHKRVQENMHEMRVCFIARLDDKRTD